MDSSQIIMVVVFIIFIILSGMFSSSETAFTAVNKIHIKTLAQDNKKAALVEKLLEDQDGLLSAVLVGNNLVNIGASSLTTSFVISIFGNNSLPVALSTGFVTLMILIFGEITPKTIANRDAETVCMRYVYFIQFIYVLFKPIVFLLKKISHLLMRDNIEEGPTMTQEDLITIVNVSHEEGVLEDDEKEMLHNIFDFGDKEIKEIMTPRVNVEVLEDDIAYDELRQELKENSYSRLPVVDSEDRDTIIGVFNIKDLIVRDVHASKFTIKDYIREPYFVYEFNKISDVFMSMRDDHISLAVVLDEYGVMAGIVTIEDIVEEIVGDIDDEFDEESNDIIKVNDHVYLLEGTLDIDEVNEECGTHFESEDFESIGGLVLGQVNGTPERLQKVQIDNCLFTIEKVDKNRIERLKLTILKEEA